MLPVMYRYSGGQHVGGIAVRVMWPTKPAAAPFASGVPTVTKLDDCTGGLHDGNASGGPCVRFGAVQVLYAGTKATRSGVAPFGRGCVAPAIEAVNISATAAAA